MEVNMERVEKIGQDPVTEKTSLLVELFSWALAGLGFIVLCIATFSYGKGPTKDVVAYLAAGTAMMFLGANGRYVKSWKFGSAEMQMQELKATLQDAQATLGQLRKIAETLVHEVVEVQVNDSLHAYGRTVSGRNAAARIAAVDSLRDILREVASSETAIRSAVDTWVRSIAYQMAWKLGFNRLGGEAGNAFMQANRIEWERLAKLGEYEGDHAKLHRLLLDVSQFGLPFNPNSPPTPSEVADYFEQSINHIADKEAAFVKDNPSINYVPTASWAARAHLAQWIPRLRQFERTGQMDNPAEWIAVIGEQP